MLKSLLRIAAQISRRIYVRVILFAVLNIVALVAARVLAPIIPDDLGLVIGAGSVDTILQIIASSMLAVTTFSLTIMTAAFGRASGQWTPRSHIVLREDTVTHSVLATFLGAYLFALIAIILRATEFFGPREIVVLFVITIIVVVAIIVSIIRWIVHLEGLGSLTETARRMEEQAAQALRSNAELPCSGGHALRDASRIIPPQTHVIHAPQHGYVQQLFEHALQATAEANSAQIYVVARVGAYLQKGDALAHVSGPEKLGETARAAIREAIPVRDVRSFDQDPVFGLSVLAEVATRALSPGVNDPGTAIDILHRLSHLIPLAGPALDLPDDSVRHDRLWVRPLDPDALFRASLDPIARCAGDAVEVQIALQNALAAVIRQSDGRLADAARACAARAMRRAEQALQDEDDLARLGASFAEA